MKHVENITLRQTQPLDRSQTYKPYIDKTGPDRQPLDRTQTDEPYIDRIGHDI